jgi:hypothetical protein
MGIKSTAGSVWSGITHHLPRFSAKLLIMSAVLGAMIVAGFTLFIWDMDFYARLTPTGQDELNYQRVGFALRTMAIAGLPLYLLAREIKAPVSALSSVLVLWVLSTLLCLVAALGFLSEAQDYHFRKATAVTDTQAAVVKTVDAQLDDLDREAADVKTNRDSLIAGARQSMEYVLNDGVPGNDDLTTFESQIAVYQADAQTQLNLIQSSKDALRKQALEATVTGTEETVGDSAIHPVFAMISGAMPGGPTWWRDAFTLLSAVTLELLVAVGFGAWWAIVRHGKVVPVHEGYSEDVPEGTVNINMTEAEWKAYEDALAAAENAPPQDPSDLRRIGQEGYWIERIGKALKTRMRNPTAEGMFNTYFSGIGSVHELRAHLSLMLKRGALSQDHFDFITREGKYAPPEQEINGLDQEGANDVDDTDTDQLPATA